MCENELNIAFWPTDLCLGKLWTPKMCDFTTKTIGSYNVSNNEMKFDALPKVVPNEYFMKPWRVKTCVRMLPCKEVYPPSKGGYQKIDQLLRYVNKQTIDSHIDFVCGRHLLKKVILSFTKKEFRLKLMAYKRNGTIYLSLLRTPFDGYSGEPIPNGLDFEDFLLNGKLKFFVIEF